MRIAVKQGIPSFQITPINVYRLNTKKLSAYHYMKFIYDDNNWLFDDYNKMINDK